MDNRKPRGVQRAIPECLSRINTPLVVDEWEKFLNHHPDGVWGLPVEGDEGGIPDRFPIRRLCVQASWV